MTSINPTGIKKYYIGFIVLAVFTLGIAIFVIVQGTGSKQDAKTTKKAQDIATKLNAYVSKNRKIPDSLNEVGIKDAPSTISYKAQDGVSYEFCATYKAASSYGGGADITSLLWGSALRDYSKVDSSNYDSSDTSSYKPSTLYLPYSHKKGQNCQTVQPYNLSSGGYTPFDNYPPAPIQYPSSFASKANDTERQTDIKAIHGQLEAYYAQVGKYPTLANLNDKDFRSKSLKGLDEEALKDPKGGSSVIVFKPIKNFYSYEVEKSGGGGCDNVKNECTSYTLTATLDDGTTFTKLSLN